MIHPKVYLRNSEYNPQTPHDTNINPRKYFTQGLAFGRGVRAVDAREKAALAV